MEGDSMTWEFDVPTSHVNFNDPDELDEDVLTSYFNKQEENLEEIEGNSTTQPLFNVDLNTKTSTARKVKKTPRKKPQVGPGTPVKARSSKRLKLNDSANLNLSTKSASGKHPLSREERELEEIRRAKEESKRVKEDSKKSFKALSVPPPKRTYKPQITQVSEFRFATDKRLKSHGMVTRADAPAERSFDKNLRSSNTVEHTMKTTIPKPFSFDSKNRKRKMNDDECSSGKYVPTAKAINDFHNKTPSRYRVPSKLNKGVIPKGPMKALKMTHPQTPNLRVSKRARPDTHIESQQEKDEKELEEIKKHKFQAKPVNKAVLSGPSKLKEVEKKEPTVPIGFNFASDKLQIKTTNTKKTPVKAFKANPIPTGIFDGVKGLQEKQHIPPTKPQSPKFLSKGKTRPVELANEVPPMPKYYKPPPISTGVKHTKVEPRSVTKPVPFGFDASDQKRFAEKEKKIQEAIEEEKKKASSFKARPLPKLSPCKLPEIEKMPLTTPQPFQLNIDQRCNPRVEQAKQQLEEQKQQEQEKRLFKANTSYDKILHSEGWKPALEHKVTAPMEFELNSSARAKKREEYDEWRREQDDEMSRREERRREEQAAADAEEVKKLRKQMEVHAQPVRNYKKFEVTKSEKELTVPQTPKFSQRFNK